MSILGAPLPVGSQAPDFTLKDHEGRDVRLSSLRGRRVMLVFYPGDDTPTCSLQLSELRDVNDELEAHGIQMFGVNPASELSHQKFIRKLCLPFPLLVDRGGHVAKLYNCGFWLLVRRTVYVIGADGRIEFAERGKPTPECVFEALSKH